MISTSRKISFLLLTFAAILGIYYGINAYMPHANDPKPLKPFVLRDTNGQVFNEQSLRGHWTVLFFGYMRCPDICPRTLATVRDTWHVLAQGQDQNANVLPAQFMFIDISPKIADHSKLRDFLSNYHPAFKGATGNQEAIKQLGSQLDVFAQDTGDKIDHTAALMVIDPKGRLSTILTPPFNAPDLAKELQALWAIM